MILLEVIFWSGLFLLFYTYLGYPLLLIVANKMLPPKSLSEKESERRPVVSILIAAYNEEKVIGDKLKNCLALDYPAELLQIYIASDGSSDNTNDIVKGYAEKEKRIHLLEFPRTGKSGVLNKAMACLKSEIVVFSDANTEYMRDALKNLIKHFSDEKVGCVCGRLIYRNPGEVVSGKGESFYWRYETALKKMESRLGYVAGANGAIYAIRRELFELLPAGTINDDFTISMRIVQKGFKSMYDENAIAYEYVAPNMKSEFRRHMRDGAGHYIAVYHLLGLLNPFLGLRSFIYWSHRLLRWAAPFVLIVLFFLNMLLSNNLFYLFLFIIHMGFYLLAVVGLIYVKTKKLPIFMYVPFYFCNLNLALLLGFLKAVTGSQKMTWESTERLPKNV
ncbi:MAG: glycosyltransferase family 2 protein [Candidatus Omnitrophota bacterium]|jgi:cellulose synthase/poly-beta-1,6-N-acetylglucosamine synthase-like glycosyltransferase